MTRTPLRLAFLVGLAAVIAPTASARVARPQIVSQDLIYREWSKSAVRWQCAPLAFTVRGKLQAKARRADFSDGWSVAYDLPGKRSAFGLAGTGIADADRVPAAERARRLAAQWPYTRRLPRLSQIGIAGYGIEGAQPYSAENPDGTGEDSLAYVYVGGQACLYNVWSKLGRRHLEQLLDGLVILPMKAKVG